MGMGAGGMTSSSQPLNCCVIADVCSNCRRIVGTFGDASSVCNAGEEKIAASNNEKACDDLVNMGEPSSCSSATESYSIRNALVACAAPTNGTGGGGQATAKGAVKLLLTPGSLPNCGRPDTYIQVGNVNGKTSVDVVDGGDFSVICSVKKSGGGFALSGRLQQVTTQTIFQIDGAIAPTGESTASVQISNHDTQTNVFSSDACIFTLAPSAVPAGAIAPGRVYGAFSCPMITEPIAMKTCAVTGLDGTETVGGYVAFDDCAQ